MSIQVILLDIEGAITPIEFVKQTLFPYAKAHMGDLVAANRAALNEELTQLAAEHSADPAYQESLDLASPASITAYLHFLIDIDYRKSAPLKSLEGEVWQAGYETGALRAPVFPDVRPAFERWSNAGMRIAIYSSGSVLAQKLLFRYTDQGDLSPYLSGYFDAKTGPKLASMSYGRISGELKTRPSEILFISDTTEELDAANRCGLNVLLSVRPGNASLAEPTNHRAITSFAVVLENLSLAV